MDQITLRLSEGLLDDVEAAADEQGLSRSEYIRAVLDERDERVDVDAFQALARELRDREEELAAAREGRVPVDDLQTVARELRTTKQELADAEARRDDLRRQLTAANSRQDDVGELVEYVEEEKALQEWREERESAPVWRRFKWWVFGAPMGTTDEQASRERVVADDSEEHSSPAGEGSDLEDSDVVGEK